eukprot:CAMPEP_0174763548 /NCGR_PEP_ID=MMETSP1094-20130205/110336_1 /TAXON_ID=156173 /ORGANISM="Chrysochromulina brevifilum, Strain UTEX LB 985" /LENGTH=47 /DNA_ID= /DNA_START= /DNA_END= /DNA_ORIENTATION=
MTRPVTERKEHATMKGHLACSGDRGASHQRGMTNTDWFLLTGQKAAV